MATGYSFSYMQTDNVCSQSVWKWSKELLLCNCTGHTALICSPARETKARGSSSPNKDTSLASAWAWKENLVQTGSQAAELCFSASFQLSMKDSSCYSPGASSVWIFSAQKQHWSSLPSLTSINSLIILFNNPPSRLHVSCCLTTICL